MRLFRRLPHKVDPIGDGLLTALLTEQMREYSRSIIRDGPTAPKGHIAPRPWAIRFGESGAYAQNDLFRVVSPNGVVDSGEPDAPQHVFQDANVPKLRSVQDLRQRKRLLALVVLFGLVEF